MTAADSERELSEWQEGLEALYHRSVELNLPSEGALAGACVEAVRALLLEAEGLFGDMGRADALGGAEDVSAVALVDLRQKALRVETAAASNHGPAVLDEAHSAVRRVRRATVMVEAALSAATGRSARLSLAHQLETSLEVRREYALLRALLRPAADKGAERLARLRLVGTRIAMILGGSRAPEIRPRDREELRSLQERILACLRAKPGPWRNATAERLWGDLVGFGVLLGEVRRRAELVLHDAEARHALSEVLRTSDQAALRKHVDTHQRALLGLHDALDDALLAKEVAEGRLLEACEQACGDIGLLFDAEAFEASGVRSVFDDFEGHEAAS